MKLNIPAFRMFCSEEDLLTEKRRVKFYFFRDIGELCGNKQNHPIKLSNFKVQKNCFEPPLINRNGFQGNHESV